MNTHFQCRVFDTLLSDQIVTPFVPLWSHFQHLQFPRSWEDWTAYDLEICDHCDAVIRLNANLPEHKYLVEESRGADGEVEHFRKQDKPVFYSIQECYDWAMGRKAAQVEVHTDPSCVFNYCADPEVCKKDGCQNRQVVS